MTRREYIKIARQITDNKFLVDSVENPSQFMTKTHIAIIKIVLRERGII